MDKRLFEKLYDTHFKEVYLYLLSLSKQKEWAEDLVQETFVQAFLSLPKGHENMRAWLFLTARNLFISEYRKRKTEVLTDFACMDIATDPEILESLLLKEDIQKLYIQLLALSERKREVLILMYFGELSQKEIAKILYISPENVRVLAHRAKKELKQRLEEDNELS